MTSTLVRATRPANASRDDGVPSIEVGPGSRQQLQIGVWMMEPGEDAIVAARIRSILAGT